jgi:transposase InsO family protein
VVPEETSLRKTLLQEYHDGPTAGHPGVWKTYRAIRRDYWWPTLHKDTEEYVKGCATCQSIKTITHRNTPPVTPIGPGEDTTPFSTITVDFITKLPPSRGCDTILTITDHDCTKAVILIPCREDMGSEEVARLFRDHAFPYTGIPRRIISDRDTRFTSQFFKELCKQLEIKQNISSAYHPQTDGQSERTNQTVETILRIFCNHQQDNWADWLKVAQYLINCRPSSTTRKPPYELWMGFIPRTHQPTRTGNVPAIEDRKSQLLQARKDVQEAISKTQSLWHKSPQFLRYHVDQRVWLEGTHLHTTHPTHKLRAKHFGPFKITEVLSLVTYRLALPPSWKIHNAFHAAVLHPYKETGFHGPNFTEPPPDLVQGQEEWEVDNVLASRRSGRKRTLQYLVRWKGFSGAHNSWEPKRNLNNATQLVKDFHDKNPRAIRQMVINQSGSDMSSAPLPDISSLCSQFDTLSLMSQETSYPSPSNSERLAILAVDTEVVAEVVADMRRTDSPPPEFPAEPDYITPSSPPPDIDFDEYLRMSPSLLNDPTPPTTFEPALYQPPSPNRRSPMRISITPHPLTSAHYHPTPRDNPNDPRNLISGVSERERERMFYSVTGLRDASLMLMQQEEAQARAIYPALVEHRSPPSEPSSESSVSSSQPSHYTIEVDIGDVQRDHPGENWITFNPALHRTSILIPASESQPEEQVPARYVHYHVDQFTGEPTISGTMGMGRPVYGETLQAAPVADAQPANYRDHRYFETFDKQYMISGPVTRALEDLGDYGLLGEVMRYRGLSAERRLLSA